MQIGNLAVVKWRAGASPRVYTLRFFFHMMPELNGDTFFSKASILVSYMKFSEGKHGVDFVWLILLFGRFFGRGSCLGTGRSFWILYLRVRHASLKTSSPIFSLEANRGKPVGSAWDFVLQCTYTNASTNLYVFLPDTTYYILPIKEVITNVVGCNRHVGMTCFSCTSLNQSK